jgi:hypothetical protein
MSVFFRFIAPPPREQAIGVLPDAINAALRAEISYHWRGREQWRKKRDRAREMGVHEWSGYYDDQVKQATTTLHTLVRVWESARRNTRQPFAQRTVLSDLAEDR